MKLDFFQCEIGFLPKPYSVVLGLGLGLMVWTWRHGIEKDLRYRLVVTVYILGLMI